MSKLLTIFAGVALWLLFAGASVESLDAVCSDGRAGEGSPLHQTLSQYSGLQAEFLCEQRCNSDFRIPLGENSISPQSIVRHRPAICMVRMGIKCGMALGQNGDVVCTADGCGDKPKLSSHAVDYYVFSLRRLII